jgi:exosortase
LFVAAFYPVWAALVSKWLTSDEYSHGFLILPICFYIIFQKRKGLASTPINPSFFGLILIIGSLGAYLFALFAGIVTLASVSMLITIFGIIIYLFGKSYFKQLYFPMFFLFLMIPIPAQIYSTLTIPLQLFVSKMSHSILFLLGLPIYREGNVIFAPQATLEVVQACSGLRSMISLLTLSLVCGYFMLRSKFLIAVLSLLSIPTTVLMNIIRVIATVLVLHFFDYDLTKGSVHTMYGLLIFLMALSIIVFIIKVLSLWDTSKPKN